MARRLRRKGVGLEAGRDTVRPREAAESAPCGAAPAGAVGAEALSSALYEGLFSAEELGALAQQFAAEPSLPGEVAVMRVLIRRVLQQSGESDPARALPLVSRGMDAICRLLRTQRVLSGQSSDSLAAAFAVALREIGEELGLGASDAGTG